MPIKKATKTTKPELKLKWEVGVEPVRMAVFENYRAVIQSTPRKSYHWTITRLTVGSGRGKVDAQWASSSDCESITEAKAQVLKSIKTDTMKKSRS